MNVRAGAVVLLVLALLLAAAAWWFMRGDVATPPAGPGSATTADDDDGHAATVAALDGTAKTAEQARAATSQVDRRAAPNDVPSAGEVLVTVRWGEDQTPAQDVEVYLSRRGVVPQFAPRDRTDAEGRVLFADVAPGAVRPVAGRSMLRAGAERFEVIAGQRHEVVINLRPGISITGRVVDDTAAPVAEADVVAADWGGGRTEVVGRTAPDGTFALRGASPVGHYGARKRGHVPSSMRTVTAEAGAEVAFEIVLSRGGGELTGCVIGPDGAPVEAALVRVGSSEQNNHKLPDGSSAMAPQPEQVHTDAAGRFAFASVVPGEVPLSVWSLGLAPWSQDVEVTAGRVNEVTVHLVAGAVLHGTVRSAEGEPVAAADVSVGNYRELGRRYFDTESDGTYRVEGLALGSQKVTVRHDEHGKAEATFEFVAGETQRWDVTLEQGLVMKGRVLDSEGQPASGVIVEASLDPWQAGDRWHGSAHSDDDGRFVLQNCLPGRTIRVTFRRKMFSELSVRDVLPGKGERTFRLPEEHWVHIEGTALGPDGEVIPGVKLSPHLSTDNSGVPVNTVDPETGAFRLGPYPPGPYSLSIAADGYPTMRLRHTIAPDETWNLGELRFAPGGTLEVHLIPVDDVSVESLRIGIYDAAGTWLTSLRVQAGSGLSEPLQPGDYELVFTGEIAAQRLPFSIRAGVQTQLDVRVVRGAKVTVSCAPPAGEPPRSIPIVVTDAAGAIVWRGGLWRRGEVFMASLPLARGEFTVTAKLDDLHGTQEFTVADEAPEVTLVLERK